jgi:hypothetical protein
MKPILQKTIKHFLNSILKLFLAGLGLHIKLCLKLFEKITLSNKLIVIFLGRGGKGGSKIGFTLSFTTSTLLKSRKYQVNLASTEATVDIFLVIQIFIELCPGPISFDQSRLVMAMVVTSRDHIFSFDQPVTIIKTQTWSRTGRSRLVTIIETQTLKY